MNLVLLLHIKSSPGEPVRCFCCEEVITDAVVILVAELHCWYFSENHSNQAADQFKKSEGRKSSKNKQLQNIDMHKGEG